MRVFVTGASGFIGSAVVPELITAGHDVVGLARSDASAAKLEQAGAAVLRGDLDDLDALAKGATDADAVIHLAFVHDFGNFDASIGKDRAAIETIGGALEGTGRPFAIASGTLGAAPGRVATERDLPTDSGNPRGANAKLTLDLAERGVRSSVVRLSPSVHGESDLHGFVPRLIQIAREKGVAGYPDDGASRWTAVHVLDAARLFRLGIENAPAGSVLHAVGDEALSIREIATAIGAQLDVPVQSIPGDQAEAHFGWLAMMLAMDSPASNAVTRELLDWEPTHPGLISDLESGFYFN
jgi:nucleoside-diphosphate-sugar epimerase